MSALALRSGLFPLGLGGLFSFDAGWLARDGLLVGVRGGESERQIDWREIPAAGRRRGVDDFSGGVTRRECREEKRAAMQSLLRSGFGAFKST